MPAAAFGSAHGPQGGRAAPSSRVRAVLTLGLAAAMACATPASSQTDPPPFTLRDVLSPAFPSYLVAARTSDRIAWVENERGVRNVYTAAAPDFVPVRLTAASQDDGVDLRPLQISDDGAVVAFIRGHAPGVGGESERPGWIANPAADPDGGTNQVWAAFTSGERPPWRVAAARNFELSPDGRWIVYVVDGQLHRAPVDPGAAPAGAGGSAPLFREFGTVSDPAWSPDSRRIAFVSTRDDHAFVGVYDTDRRRLIYLSPSVDFDTAPVWSPDGSRVAFLRRPGLPFGARAEVPPGADLPAGFLEARFRGGHTLEIRVADAGTGEGRLVWHNPPGDTRFAEMERIDWGGDHLVFRAEPGDWRHYFSVSVSGSRPEPVLLTPGDGEVERPSEVERAVLSPDGRWLYYAANHDDLDRRNLWRVPVAGGEPERLTGPPGLETYPVPLASGDRVAVMHAGPSQPQSVTLLPAGGGAPRVIAPELPSDFPAEHHVEPTHVMITAEDGVQFHNQLFLPPDIEPGERRPALLFIHGGSRQQMLLGYHYRQPHGFYHLVYGVEQYLANKGYVVLSVNYRSGTGYGRAFREMPGRGSAGNHEYRDVLAAGRWLADRPDVDPARVGVWGLSYGGILTAQALARNSDVFAAGADIGGLHLWGDSLDPESTSFRASSVSEIEGWRSPVLLFHGDDDRNVDFSQTVGLVQLLRAHDVPYELVVYPNETHYFLVFERWLETFEAMDDFFDRTLLGGG